MSSKENIPHYIDNSDVISNVIQVNISSYYDIIDKIYITSDKIYSVEAVRKDFNELKNSKQIDDWLIIKSALCHSSQNDYHEFEAMKIRKILTFEQFHERLNQYIKRFKFRNVDGDDIEFLFSGSFYLLNLSIKENEINTMNNCFECGELSFIEKLDEAINCLY